MSSKPELRYFFSYDGEIVESNLEATRAISQLYLFRHYVNCKVECYHYLRLSDTFTDPLYMLRHGIYSEESSKSVNKTLISGLLNKVKAA